MTGPLLEVRALEVSFRTRRRSAFGPKETVRAVDGVDLGVAAGDCLAIVGESGSGKSTLARAIVGLVRPSGGEVRFAGADVTHARGAALRELRRHVQMVFQDPYSSVNPYFTVGEVIAEPLENHTRERRHERDAHVAALLTRVNLAPALARRRVSALSGGQLQRVGIARALALDPQVLVADEPVSALDVSVQAQILELLHTLRSRDRIASIFITHNLAVAEHVADRIAVMYAGRIVESGNSSDVIGSPVHPYTRELVAAVPGLERRDQSGPGVPAGSASAAETGCRYRSRCTLASDVCVAEAPGVTRLGARRVRCHHAATDGADRGVIRGTAGPTA